MSLEQLLLTIGVALLVFNPKKLPLLAQHLGSLIRYINAFKQHSLDFWKKQEQQLQFQKNLEKAQHADDLYQQQRDNH